MEYFNTYGGCTAAGAAGMATLRVIQEENFQARAKRVGVYLTAKLKQLQQVRRVPFFSALFPKPGFVAACRAEGLCLRAVLGGSFAFAKLLIKAVDLSLSALLGKLPRCSWKLLFGASSSGIC